MKRLIVILLLIPSIVFGAYTEFYCNASTGSNMNGGSDAGSVTLTSTNGNWSTVTNIFTPTDGTNPVSAGVTVGQFAGLFNDGATTPVYIARITAVQNATNGTITVSATARAGTAPTTSATGRSIKVGGAWKGPNAAAGFPFTFSGTALENAKNSNGDTVRVNLKNNATYSITANVACSSGTVFFQGYSSTAGDLGKAQIDGGTSNITLVTGSTGNKFVDLIFANNGTGTAIAGLSLGTGGAALRCVAHGLRAYGFFLGTSTPCALIECEAYDCNKSNTSGIGIIDSQGSQQQIIHRCYVHDSSGSNAVGVRTVAGNGGAQLMNCIFDTLGGNAVSIAHNGTSNQIVAIIGCDFYNNTGSAIFLEGSNMNGTVYVENSNFIKNGAYAFDGNAFTSLTGWFYNNGYGSGTQANGSGDYHNTGSIILDDSSGNNSRVVYTANATPYSAPTTGNFSLTLSTSFNVGRGAFTETDGTNTGTVGYPDIGAANHQDTCGGTGPCQTSGASSY